jgi:hypothetical protein
MYVHDQLIKDRHDDLRRAAARDRAAAQARRARIPRPGHPRAARAWRHAPVRLRQLFS